LTTLQAKDRQSLAGATPIKLAGPSGRPVKAEVTHVGQGSPIVFLHGLVGLNEHWEDVVGAISAKHMCSMLQLPLLQLKGSDCSVAGVTDMTIGFLETHTSERGTPPILIGNSFGGHVACRIAIARPDLVRGLVLTGASGLLERPLTETQRIREVQIKPTRAWVAEKIGELFYDRSIMRDEDLDRAHAELSQRQGARAMVRLSRSARKDNLGAELRKLHCPALLIWGRQDIVTPPEAASEFMSRLSDAQIVWFDRCGHVPMMEHPARFAEAVLKFGARLDVAKSNAR